jgi:photosystem II stability/assembly factor-like uncharacterized protein
MTRKPAIFFGLLYFLIGACVSGGDEGRMIRRNEASAWTALGPPGGDITGLAGSAISPNELYAVSSSGFVFRSTTNGATWARTAALEPSLCDIEVDQKTASTIYVLSRNDVLYRSKDKGVTFSSFPFGSSVEVPDGKMAIHPNSPNVIYLGGSWGGSQSALQKYDIGVFKSVNGGKTWSQKKLAEGYLITSRVAISPANPAIVYLGVQYRPPDSSVHAVGVFYSTDSGGTWKNITPSFIINNPDYMVLHDLTCDPGNPGKVFFCGGSDSFATWTWSGVAQTSDFGATWTKNVKPVLNFRASALAIDKEKPDTIYLGVNELSGGEDYFYISSDGGKTFDARGKPCGEASRILVSGGVILLASSAGIFKSPDGGWIFQASDAGINATEIRCLALAPSISGTAEGAAAALYAAVSWLGSFKSTNGGKSWTPLASFFHSGWVFDLVVPKADPNRVYVSGFYMRHENTVYRSIDGGKSFQALPNRYSRPIKLGVDPANPDRVIGAGHVEVGGVWGMGVSLSTDGGLNWTQVKIRDSADFYEPPVPVVSPSNANTIYLFGRTLEEYDPFLYKSANGGMGWLKMACPPELSSIAIAPNSSNTVYAVCDNVFKSTNGGKSWKKLRKSPWGSLIAVNPSNAKEVFAVAPGRCFYSGDGGATWKDLGEGLPKFDCYAVAIDPAVRKIYLGTSGGGILCRKF